MLAGADDELADFFSQWCRWLAQERRYAEHTLSAYCNDFRDFLSFVHEHTGEIITVNAIKKLTARDFRSWLAVRHSKGYARTSTHRALAAVRSFFCLRRSISFHQKTRRCLP